MPAADAAREGPAHAEIEQAVTDLSLKHGAGFAVSVVGIMLAEQTLMNAGVLIVAAKAGSKAGLTVGITGFVFNVLLIVRAPLQLFQAIQTSILPHLAGLEARESAEEFHRAIRMTIKVIAAFAGAVAIGLLAIGPFVMTALLGDKGFHYGRWGLGLVGLGMGLHLVAGHAQPGRAGPRARAAGRDRLAHRRGAVRRADAHAGDQFLGDAGRGLLLHRRARAVRPAHGGLPAGAGRPRLAGAGVTTRQLPLRDLQAGSLAAACSIFGLLRPPASMLVSDVRRLVLSAWAAVL